MKNLQEKTVALSPSFESLDPSDTRIRLPLGEIHWPDIDEDLNTEGLLRRALSPNSSKKSSKKPYKQFLLQVRPNNPLFTIED